MPYMICLPTYLKHDQLTLNLDEEPLFEDKVRRHREYLYYVVVAAAAVNLVDVRKFTL